MSTGLAVRQKSDLQTYLEHNVGEIAAACLNFKLEAKTILALCNVLAYKTPDLLKCTKDSVLNSVVQAVSLGFDLSPSAGEAYLIPRWNKNINGFECQFQPGYQGLVKLAIGSGKVNVVQAVLVCAKDKFDVSYSPEVSLVHKPFMTGPRGDITHVYAWAKLATGERVIEIMEIAEVDAIMNRAQAKGGPWKTDKGEMTKKTVVRRLCKMLPKTPALTKALEAHDAIFGLESANSESDTPAIADNGTGVGSGKYASEEQAETYLADMGAYVERRNLQWYDRWTNKETGEVPEKLAPHLATRRMADDHLTAFAEANGMLATGSRPEGGLKSRQEGRLAAIPYYRSEKERNQLKRELKLFLDEREQAALIELRRDHPELFAEEAANMADDEWEEGGD